MAKRSRKELHSGKADRISDDDSLLARSAESIGRVIGTLQRRMQGTAKQLTGGTVVSRPGAGRVPARPRSGGAAAKPVKKAAPASTTKSKRARKRPGTRKAAGKP